LRALRQWAGYAVTVTLLVELSACTEVGSLPPTAASGLPESPRTLAPMDPNSASTMRHSVREQPRAVGRRPDHVVVVVLENKHRSDVIGNPRAPYLNKLARQGANMTRSYAVTRPSQPNYLAMFSGSTHAVKSNACPQRFKKKQNLGSQLRRAGLSFTGYSESLPKTGFTGCIRGRYQRKHNPWVNFGNLPRSTNQPFSAFPRDYRKLPTVAFVSPNMCNGMHDCSIRTGDRWMKKHFDRYAQWAKRNNSGLVVTFDENAGDRTHPIYTVIVGEGIRPRRYVQRMNHYTLLRTIEKAYGLPPLGRAAKARPLSTIWKT
jgi:phosphatidylinositol-3-phosphatase